MEKLTAVSEDTLLQLIQDIPKADAKCAETVETALSKSFIPIEAFGAIKYLLKKYAAAIGTATFPATPIKAVAICCADHGVAKENVSAYPPETTLHMVANYLISRGAAANSFADFIGAHLSVADLGINKQIDDLPGLIDFHIASGTNNSAQGAAMTREQAVQAIYYGINLAQQLHQQQGVTVFLPGEMGISNTTASAAITAALLEEPAENTTGRGTNISDSRYKTKLATVKKILTTNKPNPADPIDVLAKVGGFELGAIAGLILGAATSHSITILDGFNSSAAALIAARLNPVVTDYLLPSHLAGEQGHPLILQELGLTPFMTLNIKLGEAIGSSLLADILDMSIKAYNNLADDVEAKLLMRNKIQREIIPPASISLTHKTFDYYTKTMPSLAKDSMEQCQLRLDNLAKPIYSLGVIEQIAAQLSGILCDDLPHPEEISQHLLCFGLNDNELMTDQLACLHSFSHQAQEGPPLTTLALLTQNRSQMDAFEFGRLQGENLSMYHHVIGISLLDEDIALADELADMLCHPDGTLKWDKTDFLSHLPKDKQLLASAIMGALIAASHNRSMVILGDRGVIAIASYAAQLVPEVEPFLLPMEPQLYQLNIKIPGITAWLGMRLVQAAIYMLNTMKTFAEAKVAVANDGPGAGRQELVH